MCHPTTLAVPFESKVEQSNVQHCGKGPAAFTPRPLHGLRGSGPFLFRLCALAATGGRGGRTGSNRVRTGWRWSGLEDHEDVE